MLFSFVHAFWNAFRTALAETASNTPASPPETGQSIAEPPQNVLQPQPKSDNEHGDGGMGEPQAATTTDTAEAPPTSAIPHKPEEAEAPRPSDDTETRSPEALIEEMLAAAAGLHLGTLRKKRRRKGNTDTSPSTDTEAPTDADVDPDESTASSDTTDTNSPKKRRPKSSTQFEHHFSLDEAVKCLNEVDKLLIQAQDEIETLKQSVILYRRLHQAKLDSPMGYGGTSGSDLEVMEQHWQALQEAAARWHRTFESKHWILRDIEEGVVDFPYKSTDGEEFLLCWHQEEDGILHFHAPDDGFRSRLPITLLPD